MKKTSFSNEEYDLLVSDRDRWKAESEILSQNLGFMQQSRDQLEERLKEVTKVLEDTRAEHSAAVAQTIAATTDLHTLMQQIRDVKTTIVQLSRVITDQDDTLSISRRIVVD